LVHTDHHSVVSLERLECQLLLRLDPLFPELDDLSCENSFRGGGTVNAVGLDRDHDAATNFEELVGVQSNDTGLVRLRNIGEDAVDHRDEHAVLERVASILDDRDDVGAVRSHVDEISARSVREFDGEDSAGRANNIGNVGNGRSRRSTEIKDLTARLHVNLFHSTKDTGSQLRAEGIPDAILSLGHGRAIAVGRALGSRTLENDALLAVDGFARRQILGDEQVLLAARNEDTRMSVGLDYDLLAAFGTRPTTSSSACTTAATARGASATTRSTSSSVTEPACRMLVV